MSYRFSARLGSLAVLCLALASPAFSQAGRSEISGTIFDQAKAVLPGVTITITDENTGLTRSTVTSSDGRFVVPTLRPGTYTVKAELTGFQTLVRTGLVVAVGQELSLDLTLPLGGLTEEVSVTGEAPLVEVTTSRIGSNISSAEIDTLPSQGRNQFSLMQLVPGLTPSLQIGSFEGGQYNANGRETAANLFLVDGAYDNDDRRGGSQGTQARVTLDSMAEYQVLTHQYTAEFGGASGVVVNTVTRSGTNRLSGRTFYYYQDDDLNATNHFLKQEGRENPESGSKVFGGSFGGPLVRNKAFWFANVERNLINQAANLIFPPEAAPLATSYSDTTDFTGINTFVRGDYQLTGNHHLSVRWVREAVLTERDSVQDDLATPDNWRHENDSGDQVMSVAWTSVFGGHATNEFRVGHVRENLLQGPRIFFDDDWNFIGLNGREQFDIGPQNSHPDFTAGTRTTYQQDLIRSYSVEDAFTYVKPGWFGDHTFKLGFGWSRNAALPQTTGANLVGTYSFPTNLPFDPANPRTYPWRFQIRLGEIDFEQKDWRTNFYVQDKWQVAKRVTLNLGMRYDYQDLTPRTKNAFAPRVGLAYDVTGTGKTLLRGGFGKFYELHRLAILQTLLQSAVIGPAEVFDTGQVASPAVSGTIPVDPFSSGCLQPTGSNGLAMISPACRAFLEARRAQVLAGGFVNTDQATIDGDRRLPYLWGYSLGLKRELMRDVAMSVDYVGNVGRDQLGLIDINEGPLGANGRVTRLGANGFDPDGTLIPQSARSASFRRVFQYQTLDAFNSDYNALELSLEKRHANRWSGRVSYTLARARDVGAGQGAPAGRVTDDLDPRVDYGRANFDNRHAFAAGANAEIWRGLGGGFVFRYYSGYPINETVGSDVNGDGDNTDRPVRGIHDATRPILSAVDSSGRAIRNGIDGEDRMLLDGRMQYIWRLNRFQAGVFLELYNLTNRVNFGDPTGNRNSRNFMVPITAGEGRSTQLGLRLTF
jgi:hypothetical protein